MRKMKFGILLVFAVLALVSVASALPATITTSLVQAPNSPTSYVLVVTTNGDADLPAGSYNGWCVGFSIQGLGPAHEYAAYDSRGDTSTLPDYISTTNWNKINWILNNPAGDWKITQAAMWKVDGGSGATYPSDYYTSGYDQGDFNTYMGLVNAQGAFVPTNPGQKYAVILVKDYYENDLHKIWQPILIPGTIPSIPTPEFPTLALPVAMLIGVVGAVQYVRARKE